MYYRLRQVDMEGKFVNTDVIKLALPAPTGFRCWPNQVKDILYIKLPLTVSSYYDMKIYNAAGMLLKQWPHVQQHATAAGFALKGIGTEDGSLIVECSAIGKTWRQILVKSRP